MKGILKSTLLLVTIICAFVSCNSDGGLDPNALQRFFEDYGKIDQNTTLDEHGLPTVLSEGALETSRTTATFEIEDRVSGGALNKIDEKDGANEETTISTYSVVKYGVAYSINNPVPMPDAADCKVQEVDAGQAEELDGNRAGAKVRLRNLMPGTRYFARPYLKVINKNSNPTGNPKLEILGGLITEFETSHVDNLFELYTGRGAEMTYANAIRLSFEWMTIDKESDYNFFVYYADSKVDLKKAVEGKNATKRVQVRPNQDYAVIPCNENGRITNDMHLPNHAYYYTCVTERKSTGDYATGSYHDVMTADLSFYVSLDLEKFSVDNDHHPICPFKFWRNDGLREIIAYSYNDEADIMTTYSSTFLKAPEVGVAFVDEATHVQTLVPYDEKNVSNNTLTATGNIKLKPNTQYRVSLYYKVGEERAVLQTYGYFFTGLTEADKKKAKFNDHGYADLGLSFYVSPCLLRTDRRDQGDGSYYYFGATDANERLSLATTRMQRENLFSDFNTYIGYLKSKYGFFENTNVSNLQTIKKEYDIANRGFGGEWRMPTLDEVRELITKCRFEPVTDSEGQKYFMITGPNGVSIRLPMCGYYKYDSSKGWYKRYDYNKWLYFWTSQIERRTSFDHNGQFESNSYMYKYVGYYENLYGCSYGLLRGGDDNYKAMCVLPVISKE